MIRQTTMKVRVIYKLDKTVVVVHPAPNSKRSNETETEWLERVFTKAMQRQDLQGLSYDDIDNSELPQSREDRDAWEGEKGKGISINTAKAEQIRNDIEKERKIQDKIRELAIEALEKDREL